MKRLDFILAEKFGFLINYGLNKLIRPDIKLKDVTALNIGLVRWLKERYGIGGIALDVDETLKQFGSKIPNCNKEWIETISKELKIVILSNGWNKEVEDYFKQINIEYIKLGFKPAKSGFKKACQIMNLEPSKVLMIGNDLFADIYGGKRSNLKTAQVKEVREDR